MADAKVDPYTNDNLRFRKAYIRERLEALKDERTALVAEREKIDTILAAKREGRTLPKPGDTAKDAFG